MSDEILKMRGRLAATQELAETIAMGVSIDLEELRDMADKYADPIDLKTDRISIISKRLDDQVKKLRTVRTEIASLLHDLGRV
jgi:hypothetical protein